MTLYLMYNIDSIGNPFNIANLRYFSAKYCKAQLQNSYTITIFQNAGEKNRPCIREQATCR